TPPTPASTLSLHDALPIFMGRAKEYLALVQGITSHLGVSLPLWQDDTALRCGAHGVLPFLEPKQSRQIEPTVIGFQGSRTFLSPCGNTVEIGKFLFFDRRRAIYFLG